MISIIVAAAENNVVGMRGNLPWRLSSDLKRFKQITTGHTVIMGRKTYESIFERLGKPLPDRNNVVVTRNADFKARGSEVTTWENALKKYGDTSEEVFVIGGAELYKQALPHAKKIYKTAVRAQMQGDAFFPEIDPEEWTVVTSEEIAQDAKNQYPSTFVIYEKK